MESDGADAGSREVTGGEGEAVGQYLGLFSGVLQLAANAVASQSNGQSNGKSNGQSNERVPFDYERYYRALAAESAEDDNCWLSALAREGAAADEEVKHSAEGEPELVDAEGGEAREETPLALLMDAEEEEEITAAVTAAQEAARKAREERAAGVTAVEEVSEMLKSRAASGVKRDSGVRDSAVAVEAAHVPEDEESDDEDWMTSVVVTEDGGFNTQRQQEAGRQRSTVESGAGDDIPARDTVVLQSRVEVALAPNSLWARIEANEWSGNEE